MRSILPFLFPLSMFILGSCDPGMVYDQFWRIENGRWTWEDKKHFEVEVNDTISMCNIYLQVRHTVEYPLSNLYMFIRVTGPGGQYMTDTVNFLLASTDGTWIGSGIGKYRELRFLYRENTIFSQQGTYIFTLEQGMRNPELPVTDVGVRIERLIHR